MKKKNELQRIEREVDEDSLASAIEDLDAPVDIVPVDDPFAPDRGGVMTTIFFPVSFVQACTLDVTVFGKSVV